ncbi:MAG: ABC transporter substrate-binding protein, partial [Candidatus Poribacteria bacterium]|nr:ABC transporter substrate-binding protein [Candidatus Poribacteria bacterium]
SAFAAGVSILAVWGGDEEAGFRELLNGFTAETGIAVNYEGDRDVQEVVKQRLAGGNPPDIAIIPRPGEIAALAKAGALVPLPDLIDENYINENYGKGMVDLGIHSGVFYALPVKAISKSTVWYKPQSFNDLGVEIPDTWDELMAITDKYNAAGKTPWAMGGRDGWTLTDWFENIYVRVAGPEKYHQLFVTHELEWTDASVVEAMGYFRQIVDPESNILGGGEGSISTGFIEGMDNMLLDKAEMYYEGGFMGGIAKANFPDLTCGEDYAWFTFPSIKPEYGKGIVVGGDFAVVFNDNPDVRAFMKYLAGEKGNTAWASAPKGSVISVNKNVPLSVYSPCIAKEAGDLGAASIAVFDGSDMATPAVGGDAMFVGLQDFVAEPDSVNDVLE